MSTHKTLPPVTPPNPTQEDSGSLIDTSKMNEGQRAALEMAEAAREHRDARSFVGGLFMGDCAFSGVFPFPEQNPHDREQGEAFLAQLEQFLRTRVDADAIDRTGEIPDDVIEGLARMGAFGIKIPKQYGGLGLSQMNYSRAAMLLGSHDASLTALISAHQSIGVPQPLLMFGTEEQKRKYLPRVAHGEISAFALTESGVGSDPATLTTTAQPTADGKYYVINGEKLWCTNGVKAGVIVVMAQTAPKVTGGKSKKQVTAFIVEMDSPGIEILHRCHFMGLKALYNGVIRFKDVVVPRENIIWAEGKGLRVALSTLNTGRLTLPAACAGASKRCLRIVKHWARERVQWGANIGKHGAVADKIACMAANTFAMEAMTLLVAGMVDNDKAADIRLEAAMAKMWGTEKAWEIVDDTMQIRGGRGYETADSLKARGEAPVPVERFMRDCRINTIFEGSSEIMRLFIAREMLDPHLKVSAAVLDSRKPAGERLAAAAKAAGFYLFWYPRQWLPGGHDPLPAGVPEVLQKHLRYCTRTSRKLARRLFHAMAKHGPKLEREQILLGRFVDIGAELFAMVATCSRATSLAAPGGGPSQDVIELADFFCALSRNRVEQLFQGLNRNVDRKGYKVAQSVLEKTIRPIEEGIIGGDQ